MTRVLCFAVRYKSRSSNETVARNSSISLFINVNMSKADIYVVLFSLKCWKITTIDNQKSQYVSCFD